MNAEIKYIESPDIENLNQYWPEDDNNFSFYLELTVGVRNEEGGELFGITVCTPKWLLTNYNDDEVLLLRHHLIVFKYDYDRIIRKLQSIIHTLTADNWDNLAQKLSKIGYWEFEDYID